jgi:hypothetical protein
LRKPFEADALFGLVVRSIGAEPEALALPIL